MDPRPHPFAAKLTFEEAEEVRRLRARGLPLAELADRFGVARSSVSAVCHYHSHAGGTLRVALPEFERALIEELATEAEIRLEQFASALLLRALRTGDW
jgi:transcriptional regulator with XRE-family HTH domain